MNTENQNHLPHNIRHHAESPETHRAKGDCIEFAKLTLRSPLVLSEHLNGDVPFYFHGNNGVIELESRSIKHAIPNIYRDFKNGAAFVISVTPTELMPELSRRLLRKLSPELLERVGLMSLSAVRMLLPPLSESQNDSEQ